MKKQKTRNLILLVVALIFILFFSLGTVSIAVVHAEENSFTIESVKAECERLTETNVLEGAPLLNGKEITVTDYTSRAQKGNYVFQDEDSNYRDEYGSGESIHSDHLYRIIPRDLFIHEGEWFYEGNAYLFYVRTWKEFNEDVYISEAMITEKQFYINEVGEIVIGIKEPFDGAYRTSKLYDDLPYRTQITGRAPVPYQLANVSFGTLIMNEHEKNYGNEGYSLTNDQGLVLSQTRLNYSGLDGSEVGNRVESGKQIVYKTFDFIFGAVADYFGVGKIYDYLKKTGNLIKTAVVGATEEKMEVVCDNEYNIKTYGDKDYQLATNQNYVRAAEISLSDSFDKHFTLKNANMVTMLSKPDRKTHFFARMRYNIFMEKDGRKFVLNGKGELVPFNDATINDRIVSVFDTVLFDQTDDAKVGQNEGYLLSDQSNQIFHFKPDWEGKYRIVSNRNHLIQVLDENEHYVNECGTNTYWLSNKVYKIKVISDWESLGGFQLHIDFTPPDIVLGVNTITFGGGKVAYFAIGNALTKDYCYQFIGTEGMMLSFRNSNLEELVSGNPVCVNLRDEDYRFICVTTGKSVDSSTVICKQVKKVIYHYTDGIRTQIVEEGQNYELYSADVNADGWHDGAGNKVESVNFELIPTAELHLYPKEEVTYTIKYITDVGTYSQDTVSGESSKKIFFGDTVILFDRTHISNTLAASTGYTGYWVLAETRYEFGASFVYNYERDITFELVSEKKTYTVQMKTAGTAENVYDGSFTIQYGDKIAIEAPLKFGIYVSELKDQYGRTMFTGKAENVNGRWTVMLTSSVAWDIDSDTTLYVTWRKFSLIYTIKCYDSETGNIIKQDDKILLENETEATITASAISKYKFKNININGATFTEQSVTYKFYVILNPTHGIMIGSYPYNSPGYISIYYEPDNCIAEGTLITLADGRQVPVESLTGNESLLVWNLYTGTFDSASILFIDKDASATYRVINLAFSDGTELKVISEHGLWDYNLNRYVYLDEEAAQYLGHWFNKQTTDGNVMTSSRVQLTGVTVSMEETVAYSPVTYGHLCYYVNGLLSMPGGIDGLFNIFEVDAETMRYDATAMERDIAQYGLFTYEEFAQMLNVPQEVYDAFNAQYFKVAIGKGIVTEERLAELAERYARQLGIV